MTGPMDHQAGAGPNQAPGTADIGEKAAELYARHKDTAEAVPLAAADFHRAMGDEISAGPGIDAAESDTLANTTAEKGSIYRAAGSTAVDALRESRDHYEGNKGAYVAAATREAETAGVEVNGPVTLARQVKPRKEIVADPEPAGSYDYVSPPFRKAS